MSIIKNPVIKVSAVIMLVSIILSSMAFGGTYSWFVGKMPDVDIEGKMGNVDIELSSDKRTLTNKSDIDIIVRLRVIAEWVQNGTTTGVPPNDIMLGDLIENDADWTLATGESGIFLVYTGGNELGDTGYGIINPTIDSTTNEIIDQPYDVPAIGIKSTVTTPTGWKAEITLIAEALQAPRSQKAYNYTLDEDTVPSWEIVLGGGN